MSSDTIAATATPAGSGGIGIIRISGERSVPIVSSVFRSYSSGKSILADSFKSHRVVYGHIINPENQNVIDEVLVLTMLAPRSYTTEDVVEIHSHAGYVVLDLILHLLIKKGARLAEPGEFTKRAFLNGRIDLTQAESIIDIINARTEEELKIATSHNIGGMKNVVIEIRTFLVNLLSLIDASIDFPDDVEEIININKIESDFQSHVFDKINVLLKYYNDGHLFRDGVNVIIVGRPNVGKSSIMNCLVRNERVIVSSLPGTTRDMVSETVNINGIAVKICDTAGLHDASDLVEAVGIKKVYDNLIDFDLVLFVVDATCPFTDEDCLIFNKINKMHDKKIIIVINKADLIHSDKVNTVPDIFKADGSAITSALSNIGIDSLRDLIVKVFINDVKFGLSSHIVPNLRHKTALENAHKTAKAAISNIKHSEPLEIIALDIKASINALGSITGNNLDVDILDQIFNRFCIGK